MPSCPAWICLQTPRAESSTQHPSSEICKMIIPGLLGTYLSQGSHNGRPIAISVAWESVDLIGPAVVFNGLQVFFVKENVATSIWHARSFGFSKPVHVKITGRFGLPLFLQRFEALWNKENTLYKPLHAKKITIIQHICLVVFPNSSRNVSWQVMFSRPVAIPKKTNRGFIEGFSFLISNLCHAFTLASYENLRVHPPMPPNKNKALFRDY